MTAPHSLDGALCPMCAREPGAFAVFRRRGSELICGDCYQDEKAKDAACTCTTFGRCEVCR